MNFPRRSEARVAAGLLIQLMTRITYLRGWHDMLKKKRVPTSVVICTDKVYPTTGYEGLDGKYRCSSTLSLSSTPGLICTNTEWKVMVTQHEREILQWRGMQHVGLLRKMCPFSNIWARSLCAVYLVVPSSGLSFQTETWAGNVYK
jgi:hypothetical protein